jgi:hypothetical protein
MPTANPTMASATPAPRPATPVANRPPIQQPPSDAAHANEHPAANHVNHDNRPAPAPPAAIPGKKGKQKKTPEPNEASKLIAQRISQLELDAAGEKDQEAEIGGCLLLFLWGGKANGMAADISSRDWLGYDVAVCQDAAARCRQLGYCPKGIASKRFTWNLTADHGCRAGG